MKNLIYIVSILYRVFFVLVLVSVIIFWGAVENSFADDSNDPNIPPDPAFNNKPSEQKDVLGKDNFKDPWGRSPSYSSPSSSDDSSDSTSNSNGRSKSFSSDNDSDEKKSSASQYIDTQKSKPLGLNSDSDDSSDTFSSSNKSISQSSDTQMDDDKYSTDQSLDSTRLKHDDSDSEDSRSSTSSDVFSGSELLHGDHKYANEFERGSIELRSGDYTGAILWFQKGADKGSTEAAEALAGIYHSGKGVEKDIKKTFYWHNKAAKAGNPEGEYWLGDMYLTGEGVKQDNAQASYWLLKSYAHCPEDYKYLLGTDICSLGSDYENGGAEIYKENDVRHFIKKDLKKAADYYSKAAELGDAEAQESLGMMYSEGRGVEQDYKKAFDLFSKVSKKPNLYKIYRGFAEFELGYFYQDGLGVNLNLKKAKYWYRKSLEDGNENAKIVLKSF